MKLVCFVCISYGENYSKRQKRGIGTPYIGRCITSFCIQLGKKIQGDPLQKLFTTKLLCMNSFGYKYDKSDFKTVVDINYVISKISKKIKLSQKRLILEIGKPTTYVLIKIN